MFRRWRGALLALAASCLLVGCSSTPSSLAVDDAALPVQEATPSRSVATRLCAAQDAQPIARIDDPALAELSGLATTAATPRLVWAQQDSGNPSEVFAIDVTSGAVLGRFPVDAPNNDWEDLATDADGDLLIADTGDNRLRRSGIAVISVAVPADPATAGATPLRTTSVTYRYPGGPRDVEAMFVDPTNGDRYVMTKAFNLDNLTIGDDTVVYRLEPPAQAGADGTATEVARLRLGFAVATGADMSPDGRTLVVRTYGSVLVWDRPDGSSVRAMFDEEPCTAPSPDDGQSEAIAFSGDGEGFLTAAEGANPTLWMVRAAP